LPAWPLSVSFPGPGRDERRGCDENGEDTRHEPDDTQPLHPPIQSGTARAGQARHSSSPGIPSCSRARATRRCPLQYMDADGQPRREGMRGIRTALMVAVITAVSVAGVSLADGTGNGTSSKSKADAAQAKRPPARQDRFGRPTRPSRTRGPAGPGGPARANGAPEAPGVSGYQIVSAQQTIAATFDFIATCPAGKRVIGGGPRPLGGNVRGCL
jgi:hypothetical protein